MIMSTVHVQIHLPQWLCMECKCQGTWNASTSGCILIAVTLLIAALTTCRWRRSLSSFVEFCTECQKSWTVCSNSVWKWPNILQLRATSENILHQWSSGTRCILTSLFIYSIVCTKARHTTVHYCTSTWKYANNNNCETVRKRAPCISASLLQYSCMPLLPIQWRLAYCWQINISMYK